MEHASWRKLGISPNAANCATRIIRQYEQCLLANLEHYKAKYNQADFEYIQKAFELCREKGAYEKLCIHCHHYHEGVYNRKSVDRKKNYRAMCALCFEEVKNA